MISVGRFLAVWIIASTFFACTPFPYGGADGLERNLKLQGSVGGSEMAGEGSLPDSTALASKHRELIAHWSGKPARYKDDQISVWSDQSEDNEFEGSVLILLQSKENKQYEFSGESAIVTDSEIELRRIYSVRMKNQWFYADRGNTLQFDRKTEFFELEGPGRNLIYIAMP